MQDYYAVTLAGHDICIKHYGVKGMKKGVRRYQNADGTLTAEGRQKYGFKDPHVVNGAGDGKGSNEETKQKNRKIVETTNDSVYRAKDVKDHYSRKLSSRIKSEGVDRARINAQHEFDKQRYAVEDAPYNTAKNAASYAALKNAEGYMNGKITGKQLVKNVNNLRNKTGKSSMSARDILGEGKEYKYTKKGYTYIDNTIKEVTGKKKKK